MTVRLALLTGASGFVGRHVARRLLENGYRLRVIVRQPAKFRDVFPAAADTEIVPGDLLDPRTLAAGLAGATHVFHVAGLTKTLDYRQFYEVNARAADMLYSAVRERGQPLSRIVHVSSLAAMGPSPTPDPPEEFTDPRPITHYGKSKLLGEQKAWEIARDYPVTIIRPPAVFGPGDQDVLHFFKTVARGILPIVGSDDKRVSLAYVEDLAEGIVRAAESPNTAGKAYFLCYPDSYRWSELGRLTASLLGKKTRRIRIPGVVVFLVAALVEGVSVMSRRPIILNREKAREMKCRYWVCSPAAAIRDFGFAPAGDISSALRKTLAWHRQNGDLPSAG